jgi:hypothetical protein
MGELTKSESWNFIASGLLVCVFAICVAYFLARVWPRQHYPRFFGVLGGIATVAGLYVMGVPGAQFGLGALAVIAVLSVFALEELVTALFETEKPGSKKDTPPVSVAASWPGLGFFAARLTIGLLLAVALVSTLVLPRSMEKLVPASDSVGDRVAPGTMQVWAEPFATLRLQKIFNVMQDPFERADMTSNTFWDWQLNHVQTMYGVMDEVFQFVATFKDFPPRSFPPSFNPANIMESAMEDYKTRKMLRENLDP